MGDLIKDDKNNYVEIKIIQALLIDLFAFHSKSFLKFFWEDTSSPLWMKSLVSPPEID